MATVISGADYQTIATAYGKLKARLDGARGYLYDAVTTVVLMTDLEPTVDLLAEFYNAYLVNYNSINSGQPYIAAVKKLNNHILSRGGYADINAFLLHASQVENGNVPYHVPAAWADLSNTAGQTINGTYIVPDSN